jgi:uncharacterized protein YdbL (DUF1318 family)
MKSNLIFRLALFWAATVFGVVAVRAGEDAGAVKARMEQRLGAINAVKDRGAAGENNRGYLEARGGATAADQGIISAENADRQTVYAAIAAKTGANPDAVGRQRAQQLAGLARPGHWIQDASGAWRQKS